jgi:hypothetical protein
VSRTVTLVLVNGAGEPLGALPPYEVDVPYWQEVATVVTGASARYGVDVAVLRILHAERPVPHGGAVTYLAQTSGAVPARYLTPAPVDLSPDPRRAPYAQPGGPADSLRWAGSPRSFAQQRTWNLSAIWRVERPAGPVWLKQVPWFFRHEAAAIRWAAARGAGDLVPALLDDDGAGRLLLDHVDGADLYGAGPDMRDAIAADMHRIQLAAAGDVDALRAAGIPCHRFLDDIPAVVARYGDGDPRLAELVAGLDARLAAVAACGLPDALVHGDLHPGNVRSCGRRRVLIDWGDCFVGHPGFDILRLTSDLDPPDAARLVDAWAARWRSAVPDSDPLRAVELLRPVAALRNAAGYAAFLAHIEPAEHPYHAADVPHWLARAASLHAASPPGARSAM